MKYKASNTTIHLRGYYTDGVFVDFNGDVTAIVVRVKGIEYRQTIDEFIANTKGGN